MSYDLFLYSLAAISLAIGGFRIPPFHPHWDWLQVAGFFLVLSLIV